MTKWIGALAVAAVVALPGAARAHEGHTHKVMGTVASVQGSGVEVKGTDGKVVAITIDSKTAITRGKAKADATALKVGERVSIDYVQDKNKLNTAKAIKLGQAPAPAPAPAKK